MGIQPRLQQLEETIVGMAAGNVAALSVANVIREELAALQIPAYQAGAHTRAHYERLQQLFETAVGASHSGP